MAEVTPGSSYEGGDDGKDAVDHSGQTVGAANMPEKWHTWDYTSLVLHHGCG